ncbi:hypothetical protein [Arsenicibacter rosenii]|uniref:Phage capsid protein n=1 Tax=Arsenicibacter rosenii TaxID=1750698 RepID=A0A1S2VM22_9BACT|nr:hypothetical protein [Arsenicibacter rosenii]OIN59799.1 hypothetical protein BLX24_08045 [Arsenicibacter rosenii]
MAIVTTTNDISAINSYAGSYQSQIIASVVNGLDIVNDVTLIRNLREPRILPKYSGNGGMRPLNTDVRTPKGKAGSFSTRTITPRTSMKILDVIPEELRKTFLGRDLAANQKEYPQGFAQYFWAEQGRVIQAEINDNAYYGVDSESIAAYNAGSTYAVGDRMMFTDNVFYRCVSATTAGQSPVTNPAKWVDCDSEVLAKGFGTIIAELYASGLATANKIATGAITSSNCFDKVTDFYNAMTTAKKAKGGFFYVSYDIYQKYALSLLNKFTNGTSAFQVPGTPNYFVFGSGNKWQLKPCTWMGSSQRIIATQMENLYMGTDLTSDLNSIGNMVPHIHGMTYKYQMILAYQIADPDMLFVNDQV